MSRAVAIIDRNGSIRWGNRAAMTILRKRDGLSLAGEDRFSIVDAEARALFRDALAACMTMESRSPDDAALASVAARRRRGFPYVLSLQRLPDDLCEGAQLALLFINDPEISLPAPLGLLRVAYRLSPTEARLVHALAEGTSLKEFAASRQMSYETARSHIRRILHKTGSRRQADLVRIVHRLQ